MTNLATEKAVESAERRRRQRLQLRWPVRLSRNGEGSFVATETEDLSSEGFRCMAHQPFTPGESLDCVLSLPAQQFGYGNARLSLSCRVEVVRVDALGPDSGFAIGLRIKDYALRLHESCAPPRGSRREPDVPASGP